MILVGVTHDDEQADIDYLVNKTVNLRIFSAVDGTSGFDLSLMDVGGSVLLISQFTLFADTRKGRRPGFTASAPGDIASPIFDDVAKAFEDAGVGVQLGVFGAMMNVELGERRTGDVSAGFIGSASVAAGRIGVVKRR